MSWNVNGIRACVRRGFVDFLDRSEADIVGIQDVRALPEEIPLAARTQPNWHATFAVAERRGYSGVGIYSKLEPERVETALGEPRFDVEGRFIAAHFRTGRGRFAVVNGYFPKGSGKDRDNSRVSPDPREFAGALALDLGVCRGPGVHPADRPAHQIRQREQLAKDSRRGVGALAAVALGKAHFEEVRAIERGAGEAYRSGMEGSEERAEVAARTGGWGVPKAGLGEGKPASGALAVPVAQ